MLVGPFPIGKEKGRELAFAAFEVKEDPGA